MELFIGFYEMSEEDLLRFVKESSIFGKILATFITTFMTLIPKLDNSTRKLGIHDVRSTNLYHCAYVYKNYIQIDIEEELLSKIINRSNSIILKRYKSMRQLVS